MSARQLAKARWLFVPAAALLLAGCERRPMVDALRASPDNVTAIRKALGEGKAGSAASAA